MEKKETKVQNEKKPARKNRNRRMLAEVMYIAGESPSTIAKQLRLPVKTISGWATKFSWVSRRDEFGEKNAAEYKGLVDEIVQLGLQELKKILEEACKDADKIQAIKCALDISGLKRDNKNIDFGAGGIEVILNHKAVKPGK